MTVPTSPPPVVVPGAQWWTKRPLICPECGKVFQLPDFVEPWMTRVECVPYPVVVPPIAFIRCTYCGAVSSYPGQLPVPTKGRITCRQTPLIAPDVRSAP